MSLFSSLDKISSSSDFLVIVVMVIVLNIEYWSNWTDDGSG